MPTADEIMASIAAKPLPAADPNKPLKPQGLHYEFLGAWATAYPSEPVPPPSDARLGRFKSLIAYAREQGLSDPKIIAMVHKAVTDWSGFVAFVLERGGPKMKEIRPSHAALLMHRDKLVTFSRQKAGEGGHVPEGVVIMPIGLKSSKKKA